MAAYNPGVLLCLLLIATASSMANSLDIISVLQVNVAGTLHCSLPPIPTGCPTLSGVTVYLSCDNGLTAMAQGVTDTDGKYKITYTSLNVVLFDQLQCAVFVKAPIATCNAFTTALIKASLGAVDLLGLVANYNCGDFLNVI